MRRQRSSTIMSSGSALSTRSRLVLLPPRLSLPCGFHSIRPAGRACRWSQLHAAKRNCSAGAQGAGRHSGRARHHADSFRERRSSLFPLVVRSASSARLRTMLCIAGRNHEAGDGPSFFETQAKAPLLGDDGQADFRRWRDGACTAIIAATKTRADGRHAGRTQAMAGKLKIPRRPGQMPGPRAPASRWRPETVQPRRIRQTRMKSGMAPSRQALEDKAVACTNQLPGNCDRSDRGIIRLRSGPTKRAHQALPTALGRTDNDGSSHQTGGRPSRHRRCGTADQGDLHRLGRQSRRVVRFLRLYCVSRCTSRERVAELEPTTPRPTARTSREPRRRNFAAARAANRGPDDTAQQPRPRSTRQACPTRVVAHTVSL